ncbi:MAG: hypothetical protein ACP5NZ_04430 [Nanobdellota archaeon]
MKKKVDNSKKEENKIIGIIAILIIMVLVFVLAIAYFNEFIDSPLGIFIIVAFIFLFLIIFVKTFLRIVKIIYRKMKYWDFTY